MTPQSAAYLTGCAVSEIDHRYGGKDGLTPVCLGRCAQLPSRLPIHLRHVWAKAVKDPAVLAILEDVDFPDRPATAAEECSFWIGYYHQRSARGLPPSFPARLKAAREAAGLSVIQLAEAAGLNRQSIYQYEAGERRPTWDAVQAIATALGVPTDHFRDG